MNRKEAEDYIFASYMRSEKFQSYNDKDKNKRHPELTKEILENLSTGINIGITGSKGKGSLANMLSQILMAKFRVGLFTSPHILKINERFKVDGKEISDEDFIRIVEDLKIDFDKIEKNLTKSIPISPIGIEAAIGLKYFKEKNTQINIMEFGKGAKYDDVNNVINKYCLINTIFLEHTRELGSSLEEIANDKCNIIKKGQIFAYSSSQDRQVLKILKNKARKEGVKIKVYGEDFYGENISYSFDGMTFDGVFKDRKIKNIKIPLIGLHQVKNAVLALACAIDIYESLPIEDIKKNLLDLKYPARFEIISKNPLIILDACINKKSLEPIKESLKALKIEDITSIVGIPDDKDYFGVVSGVKDISKNIILTKTSNSHYVFTDEQRQKLLANKIFVETSSDIKEALNMARKYKSPIIILGTTSLISESKEFFQTTGLFQYL